MVCTFKNPLIHKIVSLILWSVCTCKENIEKGLHSLLGGVCEHGKMKGQLGINAFDFFKSVTSVPGTENCNMHSFSGPFGKNVFPYENKMARCSKLREVAF